MKNMAMGPLREGCHGLKNMASRSVVANNAKEFMYELIWCHFDCPIELIINQGSHFLNIVVYDLTEHYAVVHNKSKPYYPHANGLVESMNKKL